MIIDTPISAEIRVDGRPVVNFAGSSYLGLSGHPAVLEAGVEALKRHGAGYQLARTYAILSKAHEEAENEVRSFFGAGAALFLAGGYSFGLVAFAALSDDRSVVFYDELAHPALRDGIRAASLRAHPYRHLDPSDLKIVLARHMRAGDRAIIATDGLYSTRGEIAPLRALADLAQQFNGFLVVDESHSFGVLGQNGRGAGEHHGLAPDVIISGGSTSKGLGVVGGVAPCTKHAVSLMRSAPASRGASSGLPAAAHMLAAALKLLSQTPNIRARLFQNIRYLKHGLRGLGLSVGDDNVPVASFFINGSQSMEHLQQELLRENILVLHSHYVGAGRDGVIRCGIFADHSQSHLDQLIDALRRRL